MSDPRREAIAVDEAALTALARALAEPVRSGGVIHLRGELGVGKTTFARALLHALGVGDRVRSPTYSLLETYAGAAGPVHHLDLYRIADPGELEWLGIADLLGPGVLLVVEWPERGTGVLPAPDLAIELAHAGTRRDMTWAAHSP